MYQAIVFLPLLGAIFAGFFGWLVPARASEVITTSLVLIAALLSWFAFYQVGIEGQDFSEIGFNVKKEILVFVYPFWIPGISSHNSAVCRFAQMVVQDFSVFFPLKGYDRHHVNGTAFTHAGGKKMVIAAFGSNHKKRADSVNGYDIFPVTA